MTIIVGSYAFFKDMPGYSSKDIDKVVLEEQPEHYQYCCEFHFTGKCVFKWRKMSFNAMLRHTKDAMQIGKFLVPEFAQAINMTFDDLKQLSPYISQLDDKHIYQRIIYEAYMHNGEMTLTDEQRQLAYEAYQLARL